MNNKGFTSIELMIVMITLLGILAVIVISDYIKMGERQKATEAIKMASFLHIALEDFYLSTNSERYPLGLDDISPNGMKFRDFLSKWSLSKTEIRIVVDFPEHPERGVIYCKLARNSYDIRVYGKRGEILINFFPENYFPNF